MRSTTELRDEILAAARAEFAQYGLAGARIDRIAKEANASKERLYAHFGDKVSLFHQLVMDDGAAIFRELELRPDNVPEFVGKIFDFALLRPDHMRMIRWAQLEGVMLEPPQDAGIDIFAGLHSAIDEAQALGLVDRRWNSAELLIMLFGLGLSWAHWPDPTVDMTDINIVSMRRADAVEAARRIIAPAGH